MGQSEALRSSSSLRVKRRKQHGMGPRSMPAAPAGNGEKMSLIATAARGHQYMRALERANQVRLARAELKRRVANGDLTAAEVILTSPWEADSMEVADLLMSQRRWGRTRARKFLLAIPMTETKTIGSMTERQRRTLASMLTLANQRRVRELEQFDGVAA